MDSAYEEFRNAYTAYMGEHASAAPNEAVLAAAKKMLAFPPEARADDEEHFSYVTETYGVIADQSRDLTEEEIASFQKGYVDFLVEARRLGADLDAEPYGADVARFVTRFSVQRYYRQVLAPFIWLLDTLSAQGILVNSPWSRVISSGYASQESYVFHQNRQFPTEIAKLCRDVYGEEDLTEDDEWDLVAFFEETNGWKMLQKRYPQLFEEVRDIRRNVLQRVGGSKRLRKILNMS